MDCDVAHTQRRDRPTFPKRKSTCRESLPIGIRRNEAERCAGQRKQNLEQAHPHSGDDMPLVAPTDPDHERKPTVIEEYEQAEVLIADMQAPATALPATQLMEEEADSISLDDLVGHISLMLPKFETHLGTGTPKKLTSWARAQEKKPKGWKFITNLTAETSSYPTLGTVSLSPSTVLCTIEDSEIEIGNIESQCTEELVMAANEAVVDCDDDWIWYAGYDNIDYSES